ncbi:hypothetical protein Tco_0262657 [Tanacetum coccineum]
MENPLETNIKQALGRFHLMMDDGRHHVPANKKGMRHDGPQDTDHKDGERSQDDDQRLDLADDLKKA